MIAPMTRVEIVCLKEARAHLVDYLHEAGVLHLESAPTAIESDPEFLSRVEFAGEDRERLTRLEEVQRALSEVKPLLTTAPSREEILAATRTVAAWPESRWTTEVNAWAEKLRTATRGTLELQDRLDVLTHYQQIFRTILPALGGNNLGLGAGSRLIVLTGDANTAADRLDGHLREEFGTACRFHYNNLDAKTVVGLITVAPELEGTVSKILGQEGVGTVDMSREQFQGETIAQIAKRIATTIEEKRAELERHRGDLRAVSEQVGAQLLAIIPVVNDAISQFRAQQQCSESQMVSVLHGWIPSDEFASLESAVNQRFPGKAVVEDIGHGGVGHHEVPTKLRNHKLFQPFEVLLGIFRPPTYGSLDPTALIAVSFIIFYGFILGDAVYGLVVILLARFMAKKLGHIPAAKSAATIGLYMGISAIVFGVIYGEYCGNFVEKTLAPALGFEMPYLFHRAHETTQLLVLGIMFGLIHIPLALILGIREDFRHHHNKHAYEKLGMLLCLVALILVACTNLGVPGLASAPIVGYGAAGVVGAVGVVFIFYAMKVMGIIGVLEVVSLGGNVLSYSRLMALGIASIALADIANEMPHMFGVLIGIPMALGIHLLNIGIGIASPTIHSLRLNFVEFLPKFYSPEGKAFNPFRKETQC